MEQIAPTRFFLGANSVRGFSSLYDSFTDPAAGEFLWVIKGGPGCGKSTFMKKLGAAAEQAGQAVEYIHCSGDPDSLDAVWFPALRTGYVDGTAPHVIEATYPGASSLYLDMGTFLDAGALEKRLPEIVDLNRRYKALYAEAYALLAAAGPLLPENAAGLWGAEEAAKIDKKLAGLAARELKRLNKPAKISHRFLSAYSCQGRVFFRESVDQLCERVCTLDNALGLGRRYLERLAAIAAGSGNDAVLCHDPLEPEKLEAVLLPETGLAFLAMEKQETCPKPWRHLRLDTLADRDAVSQKKALLRARRRESGALLDSAMETLAQAKALHDELEAVYREHVDFSGADALAKDHIGWLLGK